MRFLSILLIIALVSCNKELPKDGKIEIIPTYCKYENDIHFSPNDLKLFKEEETNKEIKLTEENSIPGTDNFKVSDLEYGDYYIEYITIYNHKNIVRFKVNHPDLKNVDLCVDYFDYESNKNVLLIDELKNDENLLLDFFHRGCFSTFEKPLLMELSKKNGKITAEYNNHKLILTDSQIKLFREFEIELRSNHSEGCSSIDTYGLFNKKHSKLYKTVDESCQWRGFENLIKLLKIEKSYPATAFYNKKQHSDNEIQLF